MTNKNQQPEDISWKLAQLGIHENDARAYIFLLERGSTLAGSKIATALSMHRQYVYEGLKRLHALGLVEKIPAGPRTKYRALPPQQLSHIAKKQVEYADSAARELELLSAVGSDQDFDIYRGTRQVLQFEENFANNLPENDTQYIIGGSTRAFFGVFGEQYEEFSRIARERKLKSYYIASPDDVEFFERIHTAQPLFEFRVLQGLSTTISSTVIRHDEVSFYSFGNPPLVYVIKSAKVAADHKKIFDVLWSVAK